MAVSGFRPLAGGRLSLFFVIITVPIMVYRPLAGYRLFPCAISFRSEALSVSVPLRGIDCFLISMINDNQALRFRPLAGYRLFRRSQFCHLGRQPRFRPLAGYRLFLDQVLAYIERSDVSVPLRGIDCFARPHICKRRYTAFPSPCGV